MYLSVEPPASTISNPTPPLYSNPLASDADILALIEPLYIMNPPRLLSIECWNPLYPTLLKYAGFTPNISIDSPINIEPENTASNPSAITGVGPTKGTFSFIENVSARLLFTS